MDRNRFRRASAREIPRDAPGIWLKAAFRTSPDFIASKIVKLLEQDRAGKETMKFVFRWNMQMNAAPRRKPYGGFRESACHVDAVANAAERFVRERLIRKRARSLAT